ncbi:MAG: aromatic amino acid lyase [Bacteriovoracaceae bacterium]|nr:aromatic amino acid lyase [Bacteriovoracaceae bacterium]
MDQINIHQKRYEFDEIAKIIFKNSENFQITFDSQVLDNVKKSQLALLAHIEKRIPIYGVTTGFGDSCHRVIELGQIEKLQNNLVSYLLCGTGDVLDQKVSKGVLFLRLISLSRGFSGVSPELLERMATYFENGWYPVIPRSGSLGASGDLIPLAYLANNLRGEGTTFGKDGKHVPMEALIKESRLEKYTFKAKEALALVNGTTTMVSQSLLNTVRASYFTELACLCSAWSCLALQGRKEAFGDLVNQRAKTHPGQRKAAGIIHQLLDDEDYKNIDLIDIDIKNSQTEQFVQDPYSLRCSPQILGPIFETIDLVKSWIETELNGVSDNPLVDSEGELKMGGNFYGGHLSMGMDYLKISLAHIADHMDRQLTLLISDKTSRGLPPNLAAWDDHNENERFLLHGLKGLHQGVNAITSEVMAKSTPGGIFSRSSESHNQDKVSLGMSAANQCHDLLEQVEDIFALYLICLAQGLDLRGIKLKGENSVKYYQMIRSNVAFVKDDIPLHDSIEKLKIALKEASTECERSLFGGNS